MLVFPDISPYNEYINWCSVMEAEVEVWREAKEPNPDADIWSEM